MMPAGRSVAERMKCYLNRGSIDPQLELFLSGLVACESCHRKVAIEPYGGAPDGFLKNADVSKSETPAPRESQCLNDKQHCALRRFGENLF